jgi:hypothetical protein
MAVPRGSRPAIDDLPVRARGIYQPLMERRNFAARQALLSRIQGEFREMPGLSLTLEQAAKLFGLPSEACTRVLGVLEHSGILRQAGDGQYRLRGAA